MYVCALRCQGVLIGHRPTTWQDAVQELEDASSGVTQPIEGRWALVYSTQVDERKQLAAPGLPQAVIDSTYALFFRFAPALAGAEEGGRRASNEQVVDLTKGRVFNRVKLAVPGRSTPVELMVNGDVEELAKGDPSDLRVTFTDFQVGLGGGAPLKLPLPRPVGSLSTTHCDADMRVSRGGRGGVFILRRLQEGRS